MSTNALLWIILLVQIVGAAGGALFVGQNKAAIAERRALKPMSCVSVAILSLCGIAVWITWLLYAIAVDDWRFAVIAAVPAGMGPLIRLIARNRPVPKVSALENPEAAVEYRVDELERALGDSGAMVIPGVDRYSLERLESLRHMLENQLRFGDQPMEHA